MGLTFHFVSSFPLPPLLHCLFVFPPILNEEAAPRSRGTVKPPLRPPLSTSYPALPPPLCVLVPFQSTPHPSTPKFFFSKNQGHLCLNEPDSRPTFFVQTLSVVSSRFILLRVPAPSTVRFYLWKVPKVRSFLTSSGLVLPRLIFRVGDSRRRRPPVFVPPLFLFHFL